MAADELRGLYLDIEVRGVEEATKDIEAASTATDSLAEDFRGLVDDSLLAAESLDVTEEKVEALGDSLTQTTGGVIALQAALSSLGDTGIGNIKSKLGGVDLSNVTVPDVEDKTIQQTLNRDVETNQPDVSQLDFDTPSPEESKFQFPSASEVSGFEFDNQAESASLYSRALDRVKQSAIGSRVANSLLSESTESAGDEFTQSSLKAQLFDGRLDSLRNTAYSTIPGLTATQSQIDEVGDEAQSSTANVLALRSALQGLGGTSSGVSLGPLTVGIGTAVVAVSTLLPLVLSLGAAFGGLLTAGLGVAGVLGGALAGGFLSLSEQVGGTEALLTEFKSALEEALSPLKQPIFADFTLDVMRGAVKLLNQFATFAAITFKQIQPLVDVVSAAFWDNTPEFFAALNYSITELAPLIADFMTWFANGMPEAIRYLTDVTKQLAPVFKDLWDSIQPLLPELIELGVIIAQTLGPALALLIDGLTLVVSAFNALPDFAQSGIILAATAIFTLVGAVSLLGSALLGIIGIIESFLIILEIGSIIYGLVGGVGILSTALGGLSSALSVAAGAVTTFLAAIGPVGWALIALGAGIAAYQTNLFGFKDAVDSTIGSLISFGEGLVHAVLNPMETLGGVIPAVTNPLETLQSAFEWFDNLSLLQTGLLATLPGVGPLLAITKGIVELSNALQNLSNIDVVDVSVNLIKQGAEDLWNWLTPDIGGFERDMQKLGEKINKQYQNLSPEEKKQAQAVIEIGQQVRSPDLGNLIPDIPDKLSLPEISMPDLPDIPQLDLSGLVPDIPEVDLSGLIPDVDLPQIDLWGGFADNFPRTAREIREETQLLQSYWEGLKVEAGNLKQSFDSLIGTPLAEFFQGLTNIPGDLKEGFDNLIGTPIADWFDSVVSDAQEWGNKLVEAIPSIPEITLPDISIPDISIPDISLPDFSGFGEALKTGLDVGMATLIDPEEWVPKVAGHWYNEGVNAVDSFISGIQNWVGGLEDIWNSLTPNVGSWFSDGKSAANTFIDGITSIDIGKRVGNWLKGLVPFMPGSDAQTGPLSNLTSWGESLGETIIQGIKSVDLQQAAKDFLGGIGKWVQNKAKGIEQTWNKYTPNLSLPDVEMPEVSMPDIPSLGELAPDVSMPDIETPSLPDVGSLTPDVDLPSMDDIQSSIPSMGEIMPDVSMPDMPDVPDLPSIDDLTPSIKMPDMPSVDLPSMGELMPSVSMPNIPSPSLPNIGSMIPSVQMPNLPSMGGIQGAIPDIGPILGGNPLGAIPNLGPAPTSPSTDNRTIDKSTSVGKGIEWNVDISGVDSPEEVKQEVQKVSQGLSAQDLVSALQGHNE